MFNCSTRKMTEEKIQRELDKIHVNIIKLSIVFSRKMKQPSIYTVGDLISEGKHVALQNLRENRPDESKGTISTYLIRAVITHFIDLMHKSYKNNPMYNIKEEQSIQVTGTLNTLISTLQIIELLSTREKEYLTTILFPPNNIKFRISKNRKATRKLIREVLDMPQKEEKEVRKGIETKLLQEMKNGD